LDQFKKQLLADKKKMQDELYADIKVIKDCIAAKNKAAALGLVEVGEKLPFGKKKKKKKAAKKAKAKAKAKAKPKKVEKKCPTKIDVEKCAKKIKDLKPKQEACKELKDIGAKDVESIHELIKKWNKQKVLKKDCTQDKGETKFHYVSRLAGHFKVKLDGLKKRIDEMVIKKKGGAALDKGCNAIKHYARQLVEVTCEKVRVDNYACQCEKVIKENKMCKKFDGCYDASVLAYKNNKLEIEKKNAAAKLEWRAVGRIECLLKVMSGKDAADEKQLVACVDGPQISTLPLKLIYPPIPPKGNCELKGVNAEKRDQCKKGDQAKPKKPVVKR